MKLIFFAVILFVVTTAIPIPDWKVPTDREVSVNKFTCTLLGIDLPQDQRKPCNRKCTLERSGIFDETNGFNVENIVTMEVSKSGRSESAARAVAEKCAIKKEASETNCDWASRGLDCLLAEQHTIPK